MKTKIIALLLAVSFVNFSISMTPKAETKIMVEKTNPLIPQAIRSPILLLQFPTKKDPVRPEALRAYTHSGSTDFCQPLKQQFQEDPLQVLYKKYRADLEQEKNNLLAEIFKKITIDTHNAHTLITMWNILIAQAKKEAIAQEKEALEKIATTPISDSLQETFKKLLAQYKVSKQIQLIGTTDENVDIATLNSVIWVNEKNFKKIQVSLNGCKAILMHEVQHILNEDFATIICLKSLLKIIDVEDAPKLMRTLSHFIEKRADLMSGILDSTIASAAIDQFERSIQNDEGDQELLALLGLDMHPSHATRISYMKTLYQDMAQAEDEREKQKGRKRIIALSSDAQQPPLKKQKRA